MIMLAKSANDLRRRILFEDMRMIIDSDCDEWRIEAEDYELLILLDREAASAMVATPLAWLADTPASRIAATRRHAGHRHAYFAIDTQCIWVKSLCRGDLSAASLAACVADVQELIEMWLAEDEDDDEQESNHDLIPNAIPAPRYR